MQADSGIHCRFCPICICFLCHILQNNDNLLNWLPLDRWNLGLTECLMYAISFFYGCKPYYLDDISIFLSVVCISLAVGSQENKYLAWRIVCSQEMHFIRQSKTSKKTCCLGSFRPPRNTIYLAVSGSQGKKFTCGRRQPRKTIYLVDVSFS